MKDKDLLKDAEPLIRAILKDLRNQIHLADLKQETIAELMQTSPSHISERLNSKLDLRLSWLLSLCIKSKIKPSSVFDIERLDREFENLLKKAD
jgi:hypothetical protein